VALVERGGIGEVWWRVMVLVEGAPVVVPVEVGGINGTW
jgi:hypothetical protein